MRAALPVIAVAVGAAAFVLAVVLRGGAGDVLSVLGLVLIGVGALVLFGRLFQDKWDRVSGSGSGSRHEISRDGGPF